MDLDWFKFRVLWRLPQAARKKIRKWIVLGDQYSAKGDAEKARLCYERSMQCAESVQAVHLRKKAQERIEFVTNG